MVVELPAITVMSRSIHRRISRTEAIGSVPLVSARNVNDVESFLRPIQFTMLAIGIVVAIIRLRHQQRTCNLPIKMPSGGRVRRFLFFFFFIAAKWHGMVYNHTWFSPAGFGTDSQCLHCSLAGMYRQTKQALTLQLAINAQIKTCQFLLRVYLCSDDPFVDALIELKLE